MPVLISNPQDELVRLDYLKWNDLYLREQPFQTFLEIPEYAPDQRRHNLEFEKGKEQLIQDIRGREEDFTLDVHGFQYFKHSSSLRAPEIYDHEAIKNIYLPEFAKFLQDNIKGADHIVVWDWRVGRVNHHVPLDSH